MTDAAASTVTTQTANEVVSSNIRAELARVGSRPTNLAKAMGEGEMWLSRRLSSKVAFSTNEVQRIADLLGVNVGSLFTDYRATKMAPALVGGGQDVHPLGLEPRTH